MKIAIIGSGIAGMVCAHLLHRRHDLTVFEAGEHIGGHTNTVPVELGGRTWAVDTGFIVHNERTYPNFTRILRDLGVATQPGPMSFSVRCEETGLEYSGSSLNTLFAQRRNLLRPAFHRMLLDIVRFNRAARRLIREGDEGLTLGSLLDRGRFSRAFADHYLIPMGASVWSADPHAMLEFPALMFARFFENHGFLDLRGRPRWLTVVGGSQRYVEKITAPWHDRVRLRCPVRAVERRPGHAQVTAAAGEPERFDEVIFACHSDQALALLRDASAAEREVLGAIRYQENEAVLHTDESLMPRLRRTWASWNYHRVRGSADRATLTYNMNILQGLDAPVQFLVTLNHTAKIDPAKTIRRITYHHPQFTLDALSAQRRHAEITGVNRTHFCGAYWRHGFHEDGVVSALTVCERFGERL